MVKVAFSPVYSLPLPEGHRFPMAKYELLPEQLLREGTLEKVNFFEPLPIQRKLILTTHTENYLTTLESLTLTKAATRRIGFPLTKELIDRELIISQGTIDCALFAIQNGLALNIAGGTHHAFADAGEGFCLLNDVGMAANYLIISNLVKKILVIDLDVHQGNGTAKIFENEPRVFTFSMHGEKNFPLHKEKSDLDIPLQDGCDDNTYLAILEKQLPKILHDFQPDFLFYVAGVDVLTTDSLGRLGLSQEGCRKRDAFVFDCAKAAGLPTVVSMGGGYSPRLSDIIEAHSNTFREAMKRWE